MMGMINRTIDWVDARLPVVNAFKNCGARVFSTHYPNPTNMWYHLGAVPPRPDYFSLTPLWEANS